MTDKLKLWDSFGKTDPTYTKENGYGKNKSTAITPMYMVKVATSQLGPIGVGWGYSVKEERFDSGKPVVLVPGNINKGTLPVYMMNDGQIVFEKVHTLLLEMWIENKANTFLQYGHTKYSYLTKTGDYYVDEEYGKKSLTDAMTKCLSLVGICSDIYMGEFDDQGYKSAAQIENDLKKADDRDKEYIAKLEAFDSFIESTLRVMNDCPTVEAMHSAYGMAVQKIDREGPILSLDLAVAKMPIDNMYHTIEKKFKGE